MPNREDTDIALGREVLRREAAALNDLADSLGDAFIAAIDAIVSAKGRVICAGVGKSGHVARKIAATLSSTGTPAYFVHPTEASHGDLGMIQDIDVVLAVSRSGDTVELDDLVNYSRRFGASLLAITAVGESALGEKADVALLIPDAPEACSETNAPTTSTTMMMALGDALAVALLKRRGFNAQEFKRFHPGGKLGAMLKTARDLMHSGAKTPLAEEADDFRIALSELSEKGLGCVGVVDGGGRLTGIVTDGDVRRLFLVGEAPATAAEAMTRSPVTLPPDALAASVLSIMNERKITQIFIVEDGRPVGVVHMHDVLRAGAM